MGLGLQLYEAIRSENNGEMWELLERIDATTINETTYYGETPLHAACTMDNVKAVNKLLSIPGVNVNAKYCVGGTPIVETVTGGSLEAFKVLLDHPQVDVNAKGNKTDTPIIEAARMRYMGTADTHSNRIEMFRMLLDHPSVDIFAKDKNGKTSLMIAAQHCSDEALEELIFHPSIDLNIVKEVRIGEEGVLEKRRSDLSKSLDMIQEVRRQKYNGSDWQADIKAENKISMEEMRKHIMMQNIRKVNLEVRKNEKKLQKNMELRVTQIKNLEETQNSELHPEKNKLEQKRYYLEKDLSKLQSKLVNIQDKIAKHDEEMKQKQEREKSILKDKFEREDEQICQQLNRLKDMSRQLAEELREQYIGLENNVSTNFEPASDIFKILVGSTLFAFIAALYLTHSFTRAE